MYYHIRPHRASVRLTASHGMITCKRLEARSTELVPRHYMASHHIACHTMQHHSTPHSTILHHYHYHAMPCYDMLCARTYMLCRAATWGWYLDIQHHIVITISAYVGINMTSHCVSICKVASHRITDWRTSAIVNDLTATATVTAAVIVHDYCSGNTCYSLFQYRRPTSNSSNQKVYHMVSSI